MTVKRLTVEIEYPEGHDAQWDAKNGELQVFRDEIVCGLHFALMDYAVKIAELEKEGVKFSEISDASTAVKATDGLVDGIALLMGHQFVMSKYMAGAIS